MNLKGFKKTHEDEHSATLQNQRGHSIKLAKKQLSKSHSDALGRLPLYAAEGADVTDQEDMPDVQPTGAGPDGVPLASAQNQEPPQEMVQQQEPTPQDQKMPVEQSPEQSAAQEANQEATNHWNDLMQGHIKPATYADLFARKSTLGKIGTIFGMALSGIGSGLSGQPNALLQMMNKEIDNDLDAQKQSAAHIQNYYHLNQQNEINKANVKKVGAETVGLLKDAQLKADTHTKNGMMLDATHHVLNSLNMLPNGSPHKTAALQKFSELQSAVNNEIQQNNSKLGQRLVSDPEGDYQQRQQQLRAAGNLGILPGADGMAQANDERHVPGFGDSSVPVPQNIREELTDHLTYEKAARNYIDFAKQHSNNWANYIKDPIKAKRIANEANNIGALLQGKFRAETNGGVYKEGEQKFIEKVIPDNPASWKAFFDAIPKVQETMKDNRMSMETKAGNYHLPVPKYYQGKYYTRGSNGEAVEVK